MRINSLRLKNWMPFGDVALDMGSLEGSVLLLGRIADGVEGESNGAGKSSVLDAVLWALYGVSRAANEDELIRLGEKDMSVYLGFSIDGRDYEVTRERRLGKSQKLALFDRTGVLSLSGNSVRETQDKIVEVLGMDHGVFTSTVFCGQGASASFASAKPAERKEVLASILNLDDYARCEEKARTLSASHARDADMIRQSIAVAESEAKASEVGPGEIEELESTMAVAEAAAAELGRRLTGIREQLEAARQATAIRRRVEADLQRAREDAGRNAHQYDGIAPRKAAEVKEVESERLRRTDSLDKEAAIRSALGEVQGKIKDMVALSDRAKALREQSVTLREQMSEVRANKSNLDTNVEQLRRRLRQIQELGAKCPTCTSDLSAERLEAVAAEITAEGQAKRLESDTLAANLDALERQFKFLDASMKDNDRQAQGQAELERDRQKYESALVQMDVHREHIRSLADRLAGIEARYADQEREVLEEAGRIKARIEALSSDPSLATKDDATSSLEAEVSRFEHQACGEAAAKAQVAEKLGRLRQRKETSTRAAQKADTDRIKLADVAEKEFVYGELTKAFGRNGIPALITDGAIAEIQAEVAARLERLSRGRIKVEFLTQKGLKSGKQVETLDIRVSDASGARDFAMYSGGEKVRISLAIRLALSKVISRRAGRRIESVFIDEISDLDPAGLDAFAGMLADIRQEYAQVFVVSHFSELKSRFPRVITVVKDRDGSRIEDEVANVGEAVAA